MESHCLLRSSVFRFALSMVESIMSGCFHFSLYFVYLSSCLFVYLYISIFVLSFVLLSQISTVPVPIPSDYVLSTESGFDACHMTK